MLAHSLFSCLLVSSASAHFVLNYPPSLGFDDDNEPESPCGGFAVTFSENPTSIPVDGFPIDLTTTHPEADFLFRATNDTAAPFTWTNLVNVVHEVSVGEFCIPDFKAPAEFVGSNGVLQIIQNGPDGILYQCATVNFVHGANMSVSSSCANATGLTATITNETSFDSSSSTSATSSVASPTATGSGAASPSATGEGLAAMNAVPSLVMTILVGLGLTAFALV